MLRNLRSHSQECALARRNVACFVRNIFCFDQSEAGGCLVNWPRPWRELNAHAWRILRAGNGDAPCHEAPCGCIWRIWALQRVGVIRVDQQQIAGLDALRSFYRYIAEICRLNSV